MRKLSLEYYIDGKPAAMCYEGNEHFVIERINALSSGAKMTPQEELFAKLFNHEKNLVKDMDMLTLRAHREQLAQIVFEARARLTAVNDEETVRSKKERGQGFTKNLEIDEVSSEAIAKISERQKKLTKMEKIREGLIAMGMSEADAEKMTSNSAIADLKAKKEGIKPFVPTVVHEPGAPEPAKVEIVEEPVKQEEKKPFVNPFAKENK